MIVHHCDHCSTRSKRVYHEEGKHTRPLPVASFDYQTMCPFEFGQREPHLGELATVLKKYTAEEVAEALKEAFSFPRLAMIRAKITR